jgi:SAM-dependent methyltransferase
LKGILIGLPDMADILSTNIKLYSTAGAADYYSQFDSLFPAEISLLEGIGGLCSSGDILDIGMGAGRTTPFLSRLGRSYLGIDYSSEMVAKCRSRFPALQFEHGDARNLGFLDADKYALVMFSFNGIDYVSHTDRIAALGEIFRVVAPGGYFVFSSHNRRYACRSPFASPVTGLRSLASYLAGSFRYLKNIRLTYEAEDHALRVDGAFNFKLVTYYIDAANQREQLLHAGFDSVAIVNQDGQDILPDSAEDSPWLYYRARKPLCSGI